MFINLFEWAAVDIKNRKHYKIWSYSTNFAALQDLKLQIKTYSSRPYILTGYFKTHGAGLAQSV
jgi:hypothetical protein